MLHTRVLHSASGGGKMVSVVKGWGAGGAGLYCFESGNGFLRAKVTNYGATLVSLQVKGRDGKYMETTLGYDTFDEWKNGGNYFGCTVGRYGNRIKHGKFTIPGQGDYTLDHCNNGENHLHGGEAAFDKRVWDAEVVDEAGVRGVKMTLKSADGDNGYPGDLFVTSWILLNADNELLLKWTATVDKKKTVCNLTNHAYWNLGGWVETGCNVLSHELTLKASRYVPVDENSIPTGDLPPVEGTPFDFRVARRIGKSVDDPLMAPQHGYDHTLVFTDSPPITHANPIAVSWAATTPHRGTLYAPSTQVGFQLHTTEPGVQLYTGNYLSPDEKGYKGAKVSHRGAACLECQHFPDSPNQPGFPSTVLAPGEKYEHTTVHKFFVNGNVSHI
eukprot:TRINITY_DN2969_c0_g1_i1.p1 TRINITY_DN2969_c0_g1~~TRINITY_DN2969_c0_g1_i1.p1  ORF type:complete len:387 (+),score=73.26 TRINITY_DN2969_c0_g1_i1:420-1580(+)